MRGYKLSVITLCLSMIVTSLLAQRNESSWGCRQGQMDAKREVNATIWWWGGCLIGLYAIAGAYLIQPSPPAGRLIGKSPEYVAAYMNCYSKRAQKIQTENAWRGCITGCITTGILTILTGLIIAIIGGVAATSS